METICTLLRNALTKAYATGRVESVSVLLAMKVLLVLALPVLMIATTAEPAGHSNTWLPRLAVAIPCHGMPSNMWGVCVTRGIAVSPVPCRSVRRARTPYKVMVMRLVATVPAVESAITPMVCVTVFLGLWVHVVRK